MELHEVISPEDVFDNNVIDEYIEALLTEL